MHSSSNLIRNILCGCAIYWICIGIFGCSTPIKTTSTASSPLAPLNPGMDAVQLDIVYVERDTNDPLLASLLWDEVDQVGTVDLQTRSRLRSEGFRIGLVGMTPPRTLQRLLGLKNDLTDAAGTSRPTELVGRQTFLRSGGTTEIQTGMLVSHMEVRLPGETEPVAVEMAYGVLHAEVERLQDGWINLHLRPELHYGNAQLRPVANETEFAYKGGKQIASYRDLEFEVTMNVGEMLIISSDADSSGLLGEKFFVNHEGPRDRRYLVAIRLTDMKKIQPLYEN